MQGLIQQIAQVAQQADETDEERANRLTDAADQSGATTETLYHVEQDVRRLARHHLRENEQTVAQAKMQATAFAPALGLDPESAEEIANVDTVVNLVGQYALARPRVAALAVRSLHETFDRNGLYEELGTEAPTPAELDAPINVDGGER